MTRWVWISLALTAIAAVVFAFFGVIRADLIMERPPIHWDFQMQPDDWTTRENFVWTLMLFPALMLAMVLLIVVLPRISPKNFEIEPFADTFGFVMTILIGYFGYLACLLLWAAIVDNPPFFKECFVSSFFILFAFLGNVLGRVQRNFWMGIRTPWTLASETVWNRTHRVAAWLWVLGGVTGAVAVLAGMPFWLAFIGLLAVALWPVAYSLILYKALQKQGKL